MKATLSRELALYALLAAVWRREPTQPVRVHSDQGSQHGSDDFKRCCKAHGLAPSMSRKGNCWDNAVMESPFTLASAKYSAADFRLLGVTGISDFMLVCSPTLEVKSIDELIKYARTPGKRQLSIAHWGMGSAAHIVGADFQARAGVKFLEVPYKGVGPSMIDISSSQVDLGFIPLGGGPALGMLQNGKIRALGIAAPVRNAAVSQVPTINESEGLKHFEHTQWVAMLAPAKTPEGVVERMTTALNEWIVSPENKARMFASASGRLDPMTPVQAAAFLKSESEKITRIARALNMDPQ